MFKLIVASGLCAVAAFAQTPLPPPPLPPANMLSPKITLDMADENFFGPIGITAALAGPGRHHSRCALFGASRHPTRANLGRW